MRNKITVPNFEVQINNVKIKSLIDGMCNTEFGKGNKISYFPLKCEQNYTALHLK